MFATYSLRSTFIIAACVLPARRSRSLLVPKVPLNRDEPNRTILSIRRVLRLIWPFGFPLHASSLGGTVCVWLARTGFPAEKAMNELSCSPQWISFLHVPSPLWTAGEIVRSTGNTMLWSCYSHPWNIYA